MPTILTTSAFDGQFPAEVYPVILNAIAGGNPFAQSLTRWDSGQTDSVFRTITGMSGAAWINEGDVKPSMTIDTEGVLVKAEELAGIPMLSDRMIRDSRTDIVAEVQRVMREFFARRLDDGLLHGNGVAPNPKGVFSVAPDAAAGDDLWDAVTIAKGEIVAAGGTPTTLALDPVAVVQEEGRIDANGYPIYRDGLTRYNGLDVVAVPSLATGEALVYDRTEVFWVVAEDFTITPSREYAPAYERDSVALRTSGQFGVGVPNPTKAIRQVTVTPAP
ncbi:hypothetical protein GCM10009789_54130 [Kribbella sancticallisti]|uniref:Phage capsid-like C-terminal domain-containing protein n=1 Tax=Kribbella sancticallisti TaxID=460087 RepID=A0ABN2E2B9_9ACTN